MSDRVVPARVRFRHLSGPRTGEVDEVTLPALLGSGPEAHVRAPGSAPRHALVFEREGEIVLQGADRGAETRLDGEAVRDAVLREGDVLQLGPEGPQVRLEAGGEPSELMLTAAPWARARGHLASLRALAESAWARISPTVRAVLVVGLLLALAATGWSHLQARRLRLEVERLREALRQAEVDRERFAARVGEERAKADADRAALASQVEDLRRQEQTLYARLADAASTEARALRAELSATRDRLATLESERAAGERIVREFGPAVCMIQGAYSFQDADGRPLRLRLDEAGAPAKDADGNSLMDAEGTGPLFEVEFLGTGFLVDRRGLVLTNRHVAEPWWNDGDARSLAERGFRPRLTTLRAFFPRQKEPFALSQGVLAERADVALLHCGLRGVRLPALPLDRSGRGAVTGQPVVLVGFPAGIEAMLAKADAGVARAVLESAGTSTGRISEALAERGLVRPSTTQGHIADVTETDVVFDAPTTQGGSGGPLLNRSGVVIGVSYAVLSRFGGNSFAVPIRHALPLLAKARKASR
ncbi:MAG TPA: trypsin-like peptidase domain-containing protein [Vicinamibacteria bacterium]|nr:trypsin-like peptidase domain-containing protein [Vicinamibacteria bacterium]